MVKLRTQALCLSVCGDLVDERLRPCVLAATVQQSIGGVTYEEATSTRRESTRPLSPDAAEPVCSGNIYFCIRTLLPSPDFPFRA